MAIKLGELKTAQNPDWCMGCGDFTILQALKMALVKTGVNQEDVVITSGIGCGSKTPHYVKVYGFEGLHGRSLPPAQGIKLSNHKLKVITLGGDGDGYGIGMGHFIHVMRRNIDMTYLVQNNHVYGLTKGQYSPTSMKGFKTITSPAGSLEEPVNPLALAIASGATFVARVFANDMVHTTKIMLEAIMHKGFALVDVQQLCTTYNKIQDLEYYKSHAAKLEDENHDPSDKQKTMQQAIREDKMPVGVFYKIDIPTYEDGVPQIQETPLVEQPIDDIDIEPLYEYYRY